MASVNFYASWLLAFGHYSAPRFERFRWPKILSLVHSVKKNSNFEIAPLFHHPYGEGKSAAISKLELFLPKRSLSYIFFALKLPLFHASIHIFFPPWLSVENWNALALQLIMNISLFALLIIALFGYHGLGCKKYEFLKTLSLESFFFSKLQSNKEK